MPGLLAKADHWRRVPLGDVATIVNGAPFSSRLFNTTGRGMPLVRIRDVARGMTDTFYDGPYDDIHLVRAGDLLVGMDGDFRVAVWHAGTALLNQRVCRVDVSRPEIYDPVFLRHVLQGYLDAIWAETSSVTVKHLSSKTLAQIPLPLPTLDEQRRIVAILEGHLSRLDASTGSLSHSRSMVDAIQRRAMVSLLAEGGDDTELDGVLTQSIGGVWGEGPGDSELDVRVIRVTEMGRLGVLNPATAATRSITQTQYASRALRAGDLLLEKSGGGPTTPVGRVGLVRELEGPSICSNFMQLMRPDIDRVHPRWLHLYLNAYHLSGRTNAMQKASTNIRNIKASEYLKIPIKVPSLERQDELIATTETWLDGAARLAESLDAGLRRGSALRRSLLSSAFSGRLMKESSLV